MASEESTFGSLGATRRALFKCVNSKVQSDSPMHVPSFHPPLILIPKVGKEESYAMAHKPTIQNSGTGLHNDTSKKLGPSVGMAVKLSQWQQKQLMHDWKPIVLRPTQPALAQHFQSPQNKHIKHFSVSLLHNNMDSGDQGNLDLTPEEEHPESPITCFGYALCSYLTFGLWQLS